MRWADALQASPVGRAERRLLNIGEDEPNIILQDPKFLKAPKAFQAREQYAWRRIPLKLADNYDDWEPMKFELHLKF